MILGLRHYTQHHNVIPLLAKISTIQLGGPWYVVNKNELKQSGFEYQKPQMIKDVPTYTDWFEYYFEGVDSVCIYPFGEISENWNHIEKLREKIYDLSRAHLSEEVEEYVESLKVMREQMSQIQESSEALDKLLEDLDLMNPDLEELLLPKIYEEHGFGDK